MDAIHSTDNKVSKLTLTCTMTLLHAAEENVIHEAVSSTCLEVLFLFKVGSQWYASNKTLFQK